MVILVFDALQKEVVDLVGLSRSYHVPVLLRVILRLPPDSISCIPYPNGGSSHLVVSENGVHLLGQRLEIRTEMQ
jgi:hypothetical protein